MKTKKLGHLSPFKIIICFKLLGLRKSAKVLLLWSFLRTGVVIGNADIETELPSPGEKISIILSKGTMLHRINDPLRKISTFSEIQDNNLLFPVPAGQLLLRFADKKLRTADGFRELVLTEDGIWGYTLIKKGLIEAEPRLREIYESEEKYYIVKEDRMQNLGTSLCYAQFGRGEIYELHDIQKNGDDVELIIPDDKKKNIRVQCPKLTKIPDFVSLPDSALLIVDVFQVLPEGIGFGKEKPTSPEDYNKIYHSWRKWFPNKKLHIYRKCLVAQESTLSRSEKTGTEIKAKVGFGMSFFDKFLTEAGISGEAGKQSEKMVTEISKTDPDIELVLDNWVLQSNDNNKTLNFIKNTQCQEGVRWYSAQSEVTGNQDFRLDTLNLPANIVKGFNAKTGIIEVRCYEQFLNLVSKLGSTVNFEKSEITFVLSNMAKIPDWKHFFSSCN